MQNNFKMEEIYLSTNLEYLKMLKNVSSQKVGDDTGIGSTFSNYVNGRSVPPVENLIKIGRILEQLLCSMQVSTSTGSGSSSGIRIFQTHSDI